MDIIQSEKIGKILGEAFKEVLQECDSQELWALLYSFLENVVEKKPNTK
jgi:hypothetical protein